ncbi:MAG: AtpZ/AtpI family protein [Lachnospirales bacterium]
MKKMKNSEKREIVSAFTLVSQMGITVLVTIIPMVIFGNFLDKTFETSPLFLTIFILFGVLAAFRNIYVVSMRFINNSEIRKNVENETLIKEKVSRDN